MRLMLILLLAFPLCSMAQINRSPMELAHETIPDYITAKIFKDKNYKPGAYTNLKESKEDFTNVVWSVQHEFGIAETVVVNGKKEERLSSHRFIFYLDKKMKVIRAESVE
jgi:hypothetical protein